MTKDEAIELLRSALRDAVGMAEAGNGWRNVEALANRALAATDGVAAPVLAAVGVEKPQQGERNAASPAEIDAIYGKSITIPSGLTLEEMRTFISSHAPAPTDAGIPISDERSYPHPKCDSACYYHCTEAGTISPPTCVQPSLAEVIAFLNGEGQLDGMSFGDSDTAKPRGRYWWRKHLMAAWQARGQQQAGVPDAVDAARFRYIEDNGTTHGGGKGFTITCFVPVDHEDMGCGIDEAITRSSAPGEA